MARVSELMTLHKKSNAVAAGMAAILLSGNGIAMTSMPGGSVTCRIVGNAKTSSGAKAAADLCRQIEAAASEKAAGVPFTVELRMRSASAVVATVRMKGGRALAEQNMATSDGVLNQRSIARFADVIAGQVAYAAGR